MGQVLKPQVEQEQVGASGSKWEQAGASGSTVKNTKHQASIMEASAWNHPYFLASWLDTHSLTYIVLVAWLLANVDVEETISVEYVRR